MRARERCTAKRLLQCLPERNHAEPDWCNPAVKRREPSGSLKEFGKCGTGALKVPGGLGTFPEFWNTVGRVPQETGGYAGSCYKGIPAASHPCWAKTRM